MAGRHFFGPADRLLDTPLERVGLDRAGGLRRDFGQALKARAARQAADPPDARCLRDRALPLWLAGERRPVRPRLVVAMGATAARGVIGRPVTIGRVRSRVRPLVPVTDALEGHGLLTVRPSSLLGITEEARTHPEWDASPGYFATTRDRLAAAG